MEKPSYFAILPAEVRYDGNISSTAKLIYAEITALSNKFGYCTAKNKFFTENYGVDSRQIRRILADLSEQGYIHVDINGRDRKIYPLTRTKMSAQEDKNVRFEEDKNVRHNNTSINNIFNNNISGCSNEISIPLNDGSVYVIEDIFIREMQKCFPIVDVKSEFWKMRAWSINNPKNRKTLKGITKFINNWLSRTQDRIASEERQKTVESSDRRMPYYEEFVGDE